MTEKRVHPLRQPRVFGAIAVAALALVLAVVGMGVDRQSLIALHGWMDPALWGVEQSTEPHRAGPDFSVQGEYAAPGAPWAVQVVALGRGRFEARALPGGLPGAGWNGDAPLTLRGQTVGELTHLDGEARAEIKAEELRLVVPGAAPQILSRVRRRNPARGAPPPPGSLVLFDQAGTTAFHGRTDAAGFLEAGARSRDAFGDFRLHLEFRTPFAPELAEQKRGNSGVYIQGRYEVQILDSFGRPPKDDGCGALYKQRAPDSNPSLPPLQWQTYDIDFRAARFDAQGSRVEKARLTLRHNGVIVHDDVELEGSTGAGEPEGPQDAPLLLQDHGHPVRFRNIWIESMAEN